MTDAVAVNVVDVFLTVKRIEEKIHLICGKDIQIHSRLYDALGCETLADTHDKLGMQAVNNLYTLLLRHFLVNNEVEYNCLRSI